MFACAGVGACAFAPSLTVDAARSQGLSWNQLVSLCTITVSVWVYLNAEPGKGDDQRGINGSSSSPKAAAKRGRSKSPRRKK
jgi:hypothetical protein